MLFWSMSIQYLLSLCGTVGRIFFFWNEGMSCSSFAYDSYALWDTCTKNICHCDHFHSITIVMMIIIILTIFLLPDCHHWRHNNHHVVIVIYLYSWGDNHTVTSIIQKPLVIWFAVTATGSLGTIISQVYILIDEPDD